MLTIRLQRVGKAKVANYRLIISEKARDTQGVYLEKLGTYNPHDKVEGIKFDAERIKYWLSKGSQTSATVHNLLVKSGIITGDKQKSVYLSGTRKAKITEKNKAKEDVAEKAKADAQAKAQAEAEAKAAKEAEEKAAAEQVNSPAGGEVEKPAEETKAEEPKPEAPVDTAPAEQV